MNILVTGGAGLIGLELCKELQRRGHGVHLFDLPEQVMRVKDHLPEGAEVHHGSILDRSSLREAMDGMDAVAHLAAYLGVARTEQHRLRTLEINIEGTKNVLDVAVQHHVGRVSFASSSEVYGEPLENPVHEGVMTQGKTVYAISKLAGEELCKAYTQRYPDLEHVILRYFNSYGRHQVAKFVVPRFIWNVLHDKPPVVFGEGNQVRSYCYASDTAWATAEALEHPDAPGEVFNIGNSAEPISLLDLAHLVIELAGKDDQLKPDVRGDFTRTDRDADREIHHRFCDATKARDVLGFEPKVTLREGISRILEDEAIFAQWEGREDMRQPDEFI